MKSTKHHRRASMLGVALALSLAASAGVATAADVPVPTATTTADPFGVVSPFNTGYDQKICHAPATGIAIRAGDSNGSTELGRVYNGSTAHVYATHASSPSIAPGWATGYGHEPGGHVVHGYFNLDYAC